MISSSRWRRDAIATLKRHPELDHDEEVVLVALDSAVAGVLAADFDADLERSEQIDLTRWRGRSRWQKLLEVATTPLRRFF